MPTGRQVKIKKKLNKLMNTQINNKLHMYQIEYVTRNGKIYLL